MTTLLVHDREVETYFDLLGRHENDMTAALGWSLARSPQLLRAVVGMVTDASFDPDEARIRLQTHHAEGGFTDIEVEVPDLLHLIFEAKRGWNLPSHEQLALYARRFAPDRADITQAIIVLTRGKKITWAGARVPDPALPPRWVNGEACSSLIEPRRC